MALRPTLLPRCAAGSTRCGRIGPYDLVEVYRARYELYPPYLIYLRVLWERYKDELELEKEDFKQDRIRLTGFQEDGVWRARRILGQHNGVLIADGVGWANPSLRRTASKCRGGPSPARLLIAPPR